MLPGRESWCKAGFRPDPKWENLKAGPPVGRGRPENKGEGLPSWDSVQIKGGAVIGACTELPRHRLGRKAAPNRRCPVLSPK